MSVTVTNCEDVNTTTQHDDLCKTAPIVASLNVCGRSFDSTGTPGYRGFVYRDPAWLRTKVSSTIYETNDKSKMRPGQI